MFRGSGSKKKSGGCPESAWLPYSSPVSPWASASASSGIGRRSLTVTCWTSGETKAL